MKDIKILLVIPLVLMLCITIGIILYDNYTTRKANDKLKKEKYEIRLKCTKLEDEKLQRLIKGE